MSLIVQKAEFALRAAKQLGIKDRSAFSRIANDIMPVVIVADTRESLNNTQERPAVTGHQFTSAAAQFPAIELQNPQNSGVVIIVDEIHVHTITAGVGSYRITTATQLTNPPAFPAQYRDGRSGQPIGQCRTQSLVAFDDGPAHWRSVANEVFVIRPSWTLQNPGGSAAGNVSIRLNFNIVLTSLFATFYFREIYPGDPTS